MSKFLDWFDNLPLALLIMMAVFMSMAPFTPEPHLVEKLRMLTHGALTKPIDIFDLFWHGIWPALLAFRLFRDWRKNNTSNNNA